MFDGGDSGSASRGEGADNAFVALEVENRARVIKSVLLPSLFRNPGRIEEYGHIKRDAGPLQDAISFVLVDSAVVLSLREELPKFLSAVEATDPQKIVRRVGWLGRTLGIDLERQVNYEAARKEVEMLLPRIDFAANSARMMSSRIDSLATECRHEQRLLASYLMAGQEYLAECPHPGLRDDGHLESPDDRQRFVDRLTELAENQKSHSQFLDQLSLLRDQITDMLERYQSTVDEMVPMWRLITQGLTGSKSVTAEIFHNATRAHADLIASLTTLYAPFLDNAEQGSPEAGAR